MSKALKVAVAGVGTVGAGVIQNIYDKSDLFEQRTGVKISVTDISSRTKAGRAVDISPYRWHDNPLDLVSSEADIIVETIGGEAGIALDLITKALKAGKHVVTANKALLAMHGNDVAKLAEENNVSLNYEAAVAGGIPIIKALKEGLSANTHQRLYGILNGTCNYILTKMQETGGSFDNILKEAQDLGYAEADPTLDIGGFDAAHKLTLLSSLAFGVPVNYAATSVEGIEHITALDIAYADRLGYCIKLFGLASRAGSSIMQRVHPVLLPPNMHGASVSGAYNAVIVQSDYAEDSVLVGCGAGRTPTASAVVADILDIARGIKTPVFGIPTDKMVDADFAPLDAHHGRYYLRLCLQDKAGAMSKVTSLLAEHDISVENLIQKDQNTENSRHVIITTHDTSEKTMQKALKDIDAIDYSVAKPV
ncbi:MAG: homoserine dehydrogenase, partial [Pseudomonadota bacterium]